MCIRLAFASGELEVRAALAQLRHGLAPMHLSEADTGTVELVLGEVLNNVVEHAYGPEATGRIEMECEPLGTALFFNVRDQGRALPGLRLPSGRPPDVDGALDDLPEGGFGWFLVRSLANGLEYRRDDGCNVLEFNIPLREMQGMA
jgi:serine/threonine-protein kinase RsbW